MKKFSVRFGLASLVALSGWSSLAAEFVETNRLAITPALLSQLADEARTNKPALRAAAARVRAALAGTEAVRTWDDPEFTFGGSIGSSKGPKFSEDGDLAYGLEQKLPLWGKPRLARGIAQAELEREQAQADYQFQMLRLDIARQALATALADRMVEIGHEDLAWIETMTRVAGERYRAGEGRQVEVLRLQNERAQRAEQWRADALQRDQERAELNRRLGRPLEAAWPLLELPALGPAIEFSERLRRLTLNYEARLKVLRHEVHHAQATARLTEKQRLPEIRLGLEGRQYSGDGQFREGMATVTLNLPWLNRNKYRKDIERDREKLRAVEQELAEYELFVPTEARRIVTRAEAARRQATLLRDEIIPRNQLALESAHTAWATNRGMFLEVMEARRMLLEARLNYARAVAEQYTMLVELTLCCGAADLEALQMLNVTGAPNEPSSEGSRKP